jgi:hypothetical protein
MQNEKDNGCVHLRVTGNGGRRIGFIENQEETNAIPG